METEMQSVRKALKHVRESRGIKSAWVAQQINVSESTYSALESGRRTLSVDRLGSLLRVYKLSWGEFGRAIDALARGRARDALSSL